MVNRRKKKLTNTRLSDEVLEEHYKYADDYFRHLVNTFKPLQEFLDADDDYSTVTEKYRTVKGGSILFRPIGLLILTEIVSALLSQKYGLSECMTMISRLPQGLTDVPLRGVIWNSTGNTINTKGKNFS